MRISGPFLVSASLLLAGFASGQASEEAAVRAAVNQYFKGHATAQSAEMSAAFLPSASASSRATPNSLAFVPPLA